MQIHELTSKKTTQVDEGLADIAAKVGAGVSKVAGGVAKARGAVAGIKGAYQGARTDQKIAATADKAYTAWNTYKQQLDKYYADSGKPAPAGTYEKALTAFVQKNLLGGAYIPNLTNKDEILGLVKKIAGTPPAPPPPPPDEPPAASGVRMGTAQKAGMPTVAPAPSSGLPTPAEQQKFQQKLAAAARKPIQETAPATNPNEKQLFTQLVRAAALSNTAAATGEKSSGTPDTSKKQVQDPSQMVGDVQAAVGSVVDKTKLAQAGQALRDRFQIDTAIDSTEDDAVDALLIAMGFQV